MSGHDVRKSDAATSDRHPLARGLENGTPMTTNEIRSGPDSSTTYQDDVVKEQQFRHSDVGTKLASGRKDR